MKVEIRRSNRRTVSLQIRGDGSVLVRAPQRMSDLEIEQFMKKHENWILKNQMRMSEQQKQAEDTGHLTEEQIRELADQALQVIPERVRYYAPQMGVTYGRITIRNQKTRWGSCSAKGNLNFNCLLMLMPSEIQDYVVVHELAHRIEMNHSPAFWQLVESILPDYRERRKWLKENGGKYIRMMCG